MKPRKERIDHIGNNSRNLIVIFVSEFYSLLKTVYQQLKKKKNTNFK